MSYDKLEMLKKLQSPNKMSNGFNGVNQFWNQKPSSEQKSPIF